MRANIIRHGAITTNNYWVYATRHDADYKLAVAKMRQTVINCSPYRYQLNGYYKKAKWHDGSVSEVVDMNNRFDMNYNLTNPETKFIDQRLAGFTNLQYNN